MQYVVNQLKEIIKKHYGLPSELEVQPSTARTPAPEDMYSDVEKSLRIPLFEPKSQRPIAFFKISDLKAADQPTIDRLRDLVHVTLQSYIDLVDQMDVAENLMQYIQMELNPEKIIRLQKEMPRKTVHSGSISLNPMLADTQTEQKEILLFSQSRKLLDQLAVHIHDTARNRFFIRIDHMPPTFLTRLNDLKGLEQTTLYIPRMYEMTPLQQKTLETYLSLNKNNRSSSLLIVGATRNPVQDLVAHRGVSKSLIQHFHLFHLLSEADASTHVSFSGLSQCAAAVLGLQPNTPSGEELVGLTKSYNLIPSLQIMSPTIH